MIEKNFFNSNFSIKINYINYVNKCLNDMYIKCNTRIYSLCKFLYYFIKTFVQSQYN